MPHGISIDNQGNIWLTDVAMHQVNNSFNLKILFKYCSKGFQIF
jgi:hypothetical protein